MNVAEYTRGIVGPRPSTISKSPAQSETGWKADTEDIVSAAAFLLALIFLVFLGIGWLMDKAAADQFIKAGTSTILAFTSLTVGIVNATKEKETGTKSNLLAILQWICIIIAIAVAIIALYRSFL